MSRQKSVDTAVRMLLGLVMAVVTTSYIEASGAWSPAGSMSTPRTSHTATLLPNGRVLVTGGHGTTGPVASAELYDPSLGTWLSTAAMSRARAGHTATLLTDGRVLVSGGSDGMWGGSAEIYDPALGTWSTTGSMSYNRASHTAMLLPDGRVLVSGGSSGGAEIYDPRLGTWSPTAGMSIERFLHTATRLQDGRVLVSGGQTRESQYFYYSVGSAEIYDPTRDTWLPTGSMTAPASFPGGRQAHSAVLLLDGQVLVSGGVSEYVLGAEQNAGCYCEYWPLGTAESYDPVSETWHETGSMRAGTRSSHMSTLLSDGRVLVSGGVDPTYYFGDVKASAELYSPADGTWSLTAGMSTPRVGHTSTLLRDGRVLVSGGTDFTYSTLASAEIYSPGAPGPEDVTAPEVACAAADGAWHNWDVTIACTASDVDPGLASHWDASFNLTTNAQEGTETASAATNSRQICDVAGNCTAAGPIAGNKVDKKPPTIAIGLPMAGATYRLRAKVGASYTCSDGGSGTTSCSGPLANGALLDTSSVGTYTFTVTAIDTVGNSSSLSVTYRVVTGRR
jgi:N-acetylneuraminic acid mutarotase